MNILFQNEVKNTVQISQSEQGEAGDILNKSKQYTRGPTVGKTTKTRGSMGRASVADDSFCFEETLYRT